EKKHYHALNAIQKILQETKYKGNVPGTELDGQNNFKFTGYLPRIRMSRAQYLDAYGVKKHESSRGKWEFSGKEVEEALSALKDLHTQNHLIISRRKRWENGKELIDRIQTISPIIRIYEGWEGLTKSEDDYLNESTESEKIKEKHKGFLVEPCPLMIDQINEYFLLKPANMYQEIKLKFPNASKYSYIFLDWIIHEAHLKKGKSNPKDWPEALEISRESLASNLRLDCYVKNRNWKRIDQIIAKCIQIALGLGWICKHETAPGKTVAVLNKFFLNKEKFDTLHKSSAILENS
ncbi:MAG: virulence factor, partial [Chlamydiales bacterium]